jgi:Ni/Fe-hydrogenase subunit HybB-like protein
MFHDVALVASLIGLGGGSLVFAVIVMRAVAFRLADGGTVGYGFGARPAVRVTDRTLRRAIALTLLGGLFGLAAAITSARFLLGLGATTALSDAFPWGLWIAFDVMCGVALAAGGFVMAGTVHVLGRERYHPLARPAVLTGFLGYLLVVVGLLYDLGRPYRVWHPIIYWQHHSVMFEVGWCVTLYTIVLGMEFSPAVFERLGWHIPLRVIRIFYIPLVIAGVLLSTLHQSSLGSLFLLVPEKLHALWYSPLLPVFFFTSAVAVGLAMTIVESNLSARFLGHGLESHLVTELGRAAAVVLAVYLVIKGADLVSSHEWQLLLSFTPFSLLFWAETGLGVVLPMLLFAIPRVRENQTWLFRAAALVVLGVVLNRLNVGLFGMMAYTGPVYWPSWTELTITISLVTGGVIVFGLAAKYLPIFEHE